MHFRGKYLQQEVMGPRTIPLSRPIGFYELAHVPPLLIVRTCNGRILPG